MIREFHLGRGGNVVLYAILQIFFSCRFVVITFFLTPLHGFEAGQRKPEFSFQVSGFRQLQGSFVLDALHRTFGHGNLDPGPALLIKS